MSDGRVHWLTEYGTTDCPEEGVRANVDDGECSACGDPVTPRAAPPVPDLREAVAAALAEWLSDFGVNDAHRQAADAVLAIPAIATALGEQP